MRTFQNIGITLIRKHQRNLNGIVFLEIPDNILGIRAGTGSENCDVFLHNSQIRCTKQ